MKNHQIIYSFLFVGVLVACASSQKEQVRQPSSHHEVHETHPMHNMKGMPATGVVGTLEDCKAALGFSEKVSAAQQNVINEIVGHRGHRLLHALWHATRSGLSASENKQTVQAYGQSWNEEHKYCPAPDNDANSSNYNPVGEDFLYMHREMIEAIRAGLIAQNLQCIQGWSKVPDLKSWPLPDADRTGAKSDKALAQLKAWDAKLQDPAWLRTVSLSQLGMALEISTHNNLHMRYATTKPPAGFPGVEKTGGAPIPYNGKFGASWPYDNYAYNWLADPYGAALNPTFWKIHGYVDALVDKWLAANNYKSISVNCPAGDSSCYRWRGTWTGEVPDSIDQESGAKEMLSRSMDESGSLDQETKSFNQSRMHQQWVGVIGGDPSIPPRDLLPGKALPAPTPQDPFEYSVQQECGPH